VIRFPGTGFPFFVVISVPGNVSSTGQDSCREPVKVIVT